MSGFDRTLTLTIQRIGGVDMVARRSNQLHFHPLSININFPLYSWVLAICQVQVLSIHVKQSYIKRWDNRWDKLICRTLQPEK